MKKSWDYIPFIDYNFTFNCRKKSFKINVNNNLGQTID